ncbi:MAG: hypothetical protein AAF380_00335 [Bacteroidota bacterium]
MHIKIKYIYIFLHFISLHKDLIASPQSTQKTSIHHKSQTASQRHIPKVLKIALPISVIAIISTWAYYSQKPAAQTTPPYQWAKRYTSSANRL